MTLDNNVKTSVNLKSDYSNSSINDSVFFNSSISIDVVCLIAVIVVLLLTIALFLRLTKRIVLLEEKVIVILRALRRSRVFSDKAPARCYSDKKELFDGTSPENVLIWKPSTFSVFVSRGSFNLFCWMCSLKILHGRSVPAHTLSPWWNWSWELTLILW